MSKILVTGGAGFIASNLVDALIEQGHEVSVIDNLATGKREYLNTKAKFFEADITDKAKVEEIFKQEKFDFVFHLAAQIDVRISVSDPEFDNKINLLGGLNILENCRKTGVKKIIFSSTGGAIYGDVEQIPTPETLEPFPVSPYGINKLAFEKYLHYYHQVYGQNYLALRFANVYGPRQYKGGEAGVVSIFVDYAVNNQKYTINGDGLQTRDYTYVGDIVSALIKAMGSDYVGSINIGTGVEATLLDIIEKIEKVLGRETLKEHGPAKLGEQRRNALANARAAEILGWRPEVDLEEGIRRTIEWTKYK